MKKVPDEWQARQATLVSVCHDINVKKVPGKWQARRATLVSMVQIKTQLSVNHCHTYRRKKRSVLNLDMSQSTVKEEIFVGEKFRTFPSKTFRMEFNFVL